MRGRMHWKKGEGVKECEGGCTGRRERAQRKAGQTGDGGKSGAQLRGERSRSCRGRCSWKRASEPRECGGGLSALMDACMQCVREGGKQRPYYHPPSTRLAPLVREKYVQEELARRLGKRADGDQLDEAELARRKVEAELYAVPEHLQPTMNDVSLSGMNAAITEFVLPADDRLRKIEETEAAKRRMLARAGNRCGGPCK
eukprot:190907-Chlamydomonas_euryale.AAC.1